MLEGWGEGLARARCPVILSAWFGLVFKIFIYLATLVLVVTGLRSGIEPVPPASGAQSFRVLATGPPGKSLLSPR